MRCDCAPAAGPVRKSLEWRLILGVHPDPPDAAFDLAAGDRRPTGMKQIALDIGLACAPSFSNFFAGPNEPALSHLQLWAGSALRSPVPTYLWGPSGSGKTHLLTSAQ